jgi:hypothetical protein
MRAYTLLVVSLSLLVVPGCSSNNSGKIVGKWSSEASKVKGINLPEGALQLEFRQDGGLVYRAGPATFEGTYSLGSGDTVTFHLKQELQGKKDHSEKIVISGDKLTMTDADGTSLTFKKAK